MDINEINRRTIEQFRAGGPIEGMHRDRLVLLTTVGRRTGQRRTTPMMFHSDGDRLLVIASNMGATKHPDWYLNLVAEPLVGVEIAAESYQATAVHENRQKSSPSRRDLHIAQPGGLVTHG